MSDSLPPHGLQHARPLCSLVNISSKKSFCLSLNNLTVIKQQKMNRKKCPILQIIWGLFKPHWRRQWHSTPVLLPGKSHGWRSLVSYSPWGHSRTQLSDFTFTFKPHTFSLNWLWFNRHLPLRRKAMTNLNNILKKSPLLQTIIWDLFKPHTFSLNLFMI